MDIVSILVICILVVATRSNAGILPTVALNRFCPVNDGSTILLEQHFTTRYYWFAHRLPAGI